jgi:hypothetical protein
MDENLKLGYWLGQRDMLASILAETRDKIKLPEQAEFYKKTFKEEHFSHKWHIS